MLLLKLQLRLENAEHMEVNQDGVDLHVDDPDGDRFGEGESDSEDEETSVNNNATPIHNKDVDRSTKKHQVKDTGHVSSSGEGRLVPRMDR